MNDETAKKTASDSGTRKRPAAAPEKRPSRALRPERFSAGLALILAAIAAVGSGYLWYTLFYQRPELLETDVVGKLEQLESDGRQLREQSAVRDEELKSLREAQGSLKAGVEKIRSDITRSRTEWLLTESERLLVIANHRVQMARDTRSALFALRTADQQLKLIVNPDVLPVRQQVAREIGLLEAIEKADINGIALRLGAMAEGVDRLPLALDVRPPKSRAAPAGAEKKDSEAAGTEGGWRAALRRFWQDLFGLVRLRTDIEAQKPLLPPEQQYFLRENLRLMLYGAQNALLQGAVPVYQQDVRTSVRWIKEYYDVNAHAVSATLAELERLAGMKLAAEPPDISGSLETLRRIAGQRTTP